MHIVGIDASLTGTGIAYLQDRREPVTEVIRSRKSGVERLIEIRDQVRSHLPFADLVVIEGYSFASANQAHQMGELGGVLRVMLAEAYVQWIEVPPSQVKKFATGRGNAKKEEMAVAIFKRWGREFATNDEADAFVLAKIGEAFLGEAGPLTAFQIDVINSLKRKKKTKKVG